MMMLSSCSIAFLTNVSKYVFKFLVGTLTLSLFKNVDIRLKLF